MRAIRSIAELTLRDHRRSEDNGEADVPIILSGWMTTDCQKIANDSFPDLADLPHAHP